MNSNDSQLADAILAASRYVRYVAIYRDGELLMRERAGISNTSSSESDKYEELIFNPTLLKLVTQRGEIDCGGVHFVLIRYGNFYQCVMPSKGGHISIGIQPDADPLALLATLRAMIPEGNL